MKILFLGNNRVGWEILAWLKRQGENIVGLVIHPPDKQKYSQEIVEASGLSDAQVFSGQDLRKPEVVAKIAALSPDIGVSILFDYILKSEIIALHPRGIVNLHPSYLPYNRGQYPNVWSIVEKTPAGATLHFIDAGIDTGDIIARRQVPVEPVDTGETLYRKLEKACVALFKHTWPIIRSGSLPPVVVENVGGTYHKTKDIEAIDCIDLDRMYRAGDLIDILRARTFPPYNGAYFWDGGRKAYLRLHLYYDND
jgi:methionyl-tRNA formyltransferase